MRILIFIIGLAALLTAGGYFFSHTNTAPADAVPTVAVYKNTGYGISFEYPYVDTLREVEDVGLDTVTISDTLGDAMKVSISPFDEDLKVLTPERVHKDLPNMVMQDVQDIQIAWGISALSFVNPGNGQNATREIWIIHKGYLYQLSTRAELTDLVDQVLKSLSLPDPTVDPSVLAGDTTN